MVGRFFQEAWFEINEGFRGTCRYGAGGENMIDAPAHGASGGVRGTVVKERVMPFALVKFSVDVDEAPGKRLLKGFSDGFMEADMVVLALGIMDVVCFRRDIHVAHPYDGCFGGEACGEPFLEASEPLVFVGVHGVFYFASLWYVGVNDVQVPKACVAEPCFIGLFAIAEPESHMVGRFARENGDAVIRFFAAEGDVPAILLECCQGERMILYFGFLDAEHIRAVLLEPLQNDGETCSYGICVECCNQHRGAPFR